MSRNPHCFDAASRGLLLCAAFCLLFGPARADSSQEIRAVYGRLDAEYSQRNSTAIAALLAPNFIRRKWNSVLSPGQYQAELTSGFDGAVSVKAATKIQRLRVVGDIAQALVARRIDFTYPSPLPGQPPPYFDIKVTHEQWKRTDGEWRMTAMSDTPLFQTLCLLNERDQEIRRQFFADRKNSFVRSQVRQVDAADQARLKQIIRQYGWPGFDLVGTEGADIAWELVQHSDTEIAFQKRCLPLLEAAVKRGQAAPDSAAYLTDRILWGEHQPQIYGTQRNSPIADPAHVDERRASVGLEPLAVYQAQLKQLYQPVERSNK